MLFKRKPKPELSEYDELVEHICSLDPLDIFQLGMDDGLIILLEILLENPEKINRDYLQAWYELRSKENPGSGMNEFLTREKAVLEAERLTS